MKVALITINDSLHEHKVDYPALQRITSNSDICEFFKSILIVNERKSIQVNILKSDEFTFGR